MYETIQANGLVFCGVIATASVEDYDANVIKKHEATISKRENTFKNYLQTVRFNAAPVLLTYADDLSLETSIQNAKEKRLSLILGQLKMKPINFGVIMIEDVHCIQNAFQKIPSLYIADGHHRSASSALLARELTQKEHTTPHAACQSFFNLFNSRKST